MSVVLDDMEFERLYQETVRELFFHEWYLLMHDDTNFSTESPIYFYRFNERKDVLMSRKDRIYNVLYSFTENQRRRCEELQSFNIKNLKKLLLTYFPYWKHFIAADFFAWKSVYGLLSPEDIELTVELESICTKYVDDLFLQQAYAWMLYAKHENNDKIHTAFQLLVTMDPGNPFVLLQYSRFLGSSCYKSTWDITYLNTASENVQTAIKSLDEEAHTFTFCYAWLWQIHSAWRDYQKAIECFDRSIDLNKENKFHKNEPYIWKANTLTSLGEFKESQSIYDQLFVGELPEKMKKDFRNFKVMAINHWNLAGFAKFRIYFMKSIELLLIERNHEFHITFYGSKYRVSDMTSALWENDFLLNDLNSFVHYYEDYLVDLPENIRMTILYLGWLYIKYEQGVLHTIFHDSRGQEKLCYYYLQTFTYEKRWIRI